jgi:actin-related protein 5
MILYTIVVTFNGENWIKKCLESIKHSNFTNKTIVNNIIVIDNGSYECRAGWSFEESPYLRFRNLVAKPKTTVNKVSLIDLTIK